MKIKKILLYIIIILLLFLFINVVRKTYILWKYENANIEYSKCTNYYKKVKNGDLLSEIWQKDGKLLYKNTSNDEERIIYSNENGTWIIVNTKNSTNTSNKVATKLSSQDTIVPSVSLSYPILPSNNLLTEIGIAFLSKITTKSVNGIECYDIHILPNYIHILVDKDSLLVKQSIEENTIKEYLDYRINNITDEEVEMPDLSEYKIQ